MSLLIYFMFLITSIFVIFIAQPNTPVSTLAYSVAAALLTMIVQIIASITTNIREGLNFVYIFCLYYNKVVRVSISYLFRIKIENKYLLVKGARLKHQFQPVGGVYKYLPSASSILKCLDVHDDNMVCIDGVAKEDLRIRIKGKHYHSLFKWFFSNKNRETSPYREFFEELVSSGILSRDNFSYIFYEYIGSRSLMNKFSHFAQSPEVIYANIYELTPTKKQKEELKQLLSKGNTENYIWVTYEEIMKEGVMDQIDNTSRIKIISRTAQWVA
ncbi:MAG: hypothetical protein HY881_09920 [Deltaproteobacteria bacterium]|nr:hypothetical protein [Deltaproteobacteria bacterium]